MASGAEFWLILAAGVLIGAVVPIVWGRGWKEEARWLTRQLDTERRDRRQARRDADHYFALWDELLQATPFHQTLDDIHTWGDDQ